MIVIANANAMLVQYLSAKLGVATGRDLPKLCREQLPRPVSIGLWVQAKLVATATDLDKFVGATIGLKLLFGVPLPPAGAITALVAVGILALEQRGYRRFELAVAALFGVVVLGSAYDLALLGANPAHIVAGMVPGFAGSDTPLLPVGIIGATVMPHVIYLHSALTKIAPRGAGETGRREALRGQRIDVVLALGTAGLVNVAMLVLAARCCTGADLAASIRSCWRVPNSAVSSAAAPRLPSR
ncbi:MAG: manganese transport protein [Mycobacterium sp.]|nr:manganese transport protein [Mycobacterium sp.]